MLNIQKLRKVLGVITVQVLVLLDIVQRVIMPQHSTQSWGVHCHGHSPDYISQSLNKHVTLSLKQAAILKRIIYNNYAVIYIQKQLIFPKKHNTY